MPPKKRPQKKSQPPANDSSQLFLGMIIGTVFGAVVMGGISFLTSSGGSSASDSSQIVAVNSSSAPETPAQNREMESSEAQASVSGTDLSSTAAAPGISVKGMTTEDMVSPDPDATATTPLPGNPASPDSADAEMAMSEEMQAEMAANAGQGNPLGNPAAPGLPLGDGSTEMSALAGNNTSANQGEPSQEFLAEMEKIEIPEEDFNLPDLIERVEPSVVRINTRSSEGYSIGSGYVISSTGLVVTNYHVIEGAKEATVEFSDGTKRDVVGFRMIDPEFDIAVIQIEIAGRKLVPLPLANELPKKGESVVAFGAPHGLSFTTTEGIISAIRSQEEMQEQMSLEMKGTWLQTSTPISPGNSGGPLVNLRGQVVAMNTMQLTIGQNLNFAVSSIDVLKQAKIASGKKVTELAPEKLKPVSKDLKRRLAKNIEKTERGYELLSKIDEIWLLLVYQRASFDPTGQLKNTVYAHARQAIERTGIELSFGEPSGDAAVMIVTVKTKMVRKAAPGTQMVTIDAFLILEDPEEKSSNKFVKVWSIDDVEIGTVAIQAIAAGAVPRSFLSKMTSLFGKFSSAQARAKREVKKRKES